MLSAQCRDDVIEVHSDDHNGQDISQLAAILSAYVDAQQAHAFRRLLWRRLGLIALFLITVESVTRLMPGAVFAIVCALLSAGGIVAALTEWRADRILTSLINRHRRSE